MPKTELEWLMSQFHQDWDLQFDTWEELVDHWREGSSAGQIGEAIRQLDDLLVSANSEQELQGSIESLHCDYYADDEGGGYRAWLGAVRGRLAASGYTDQS